MSQLALLSDPRAPLSIDGWKGAADFSEDLEYRYTLTREWPDGELHVAFGMLNPSTATHLINDPTITRCCGFARALRARKMTIVNEFALRSTDPRLLYIHRSPEGDPRNLDAIISAARSADVFICAWGAHGKLRGRDRQVLAGLRAVGVTPHALSITKAGQPGHPLYLPASLRPVPMVAA